MPGHDAAAYALNGPGDVVGASYPLGGPEGHEVAVVWSLPVSQVEGVKALDDASLAMALESASQGVSERSGEVESLRIKIQHLERELKQYRNQRENEARTLAEQLEQAAAEISRSAQEIERLNSDLSVARMRAAGSSGHAIDDAMRLQHALAPQEDELWKQAPEPDGANASVTPVIVGAEGHDEQKLLVDALLRFLGRR